VYAQINETWTAETPWLREWIAIGLIIRLYQCKFRAVRTVLKTSREWSSNKRSKLFFAEFNARVN